VSGRTRSLVVLAAAIAVVALAALVASGGSGGHQTIGERVHEIGAGLRCPVCLNLSVADSPSTLAGEMRTEIETQLRAGRRPEQIRAFFIDRYGEWILLSPPRHGWNLLPWAVPIVGLVAGVALWVAFVRRRAPGTAGEVTETEHRRIEHELADLEEPG
jgi:cytochrome c-type biogenesis protein CcmH